MEIGGSMIMESKMPIKISKKGMEFLKKIRLNRIKLDVDEEPLYIYETLEIMVKYFKLNPERYEEMIKTK